MRATHWSNSSGPVRRPGTTGIAVNASQSTIRGLAVGGYATGISVAGTSCIVEGCYLGLTASGLLAPNATGIAVTGNGDLIGGVTTAARNVISSNTSFGMNLGGSQNVVKGNYIGTDVTGTSAMGNGVGVTVTGISNTIGGTVAAARNVISGNSLDGVRLTHQSQFISGSGSSNPFPSNNRVLGNLIGVAAPAGAGAVAQPLRNIGNGILANGYFDVIGGINPGEGNEIAYNLGYGVFFSASPDITVGRQRTPTRGNSIHDNSAGGMYVGLTGVNLTEVRSDNANTSLSGSVYLFGNLITNTEYIDFYVNPAVNPQAKIYLGTSLLAVSGQGFFPFSTSLPIATTIGQVVTATVTDSDGNTSGLSIPVTVGDGRPMSWAPGQPDLMPDSDTGISSIDNLTRFNNSSPGAALNIEVGSVVNGATVTLFMDGSPISSAVATSSPLAFTPGGLFLSDGLHTFIARQQVPGELESLDSMALEVTVHSMVPNPPAPPQLDANSDSGTPGDGITTNRTPAFGFFPDANRRLALFPRRRAGQQRL